MGENEGDGAAQETGEAVTAAIENAEERADAAQAVAEDIADSARHSAIVQEVDRRNEEIGRWQEGVSNQIQALQSNQEQQLGLMRTMADQIQALSLAQQPAPPPEPPPEPPPATSIPQEPQSPTSPDAADPAPAPAAPVEADRPKKRKRRGTFW